jgi:hypothetical protein
VQENHGAWQDCDQPERCTLGFEMKMPDCDGCTNQAFMNPTPGSCDYPAGCVQKWLDNDFADPINPLNCSSQCSGPTDLADLMHAVNKENSNLVELAATLNITSYMVWQMMSSVNLNGDMGFVSALLNLILLNV